MVRHLSFFFSFFLMGNILAPFGISLEKLQKNGLGRDVKQK